MSDQARDQERAARLDALLREREPSRPLFVGQAPGRGLDGWPALTGAAGDRLGRLAGLPYPPRSRPAFAFMVATERVNLIERWPGRSPNGGDAFPLDQARAGALALLSRLQAEGRLAGRHLVLVGRGVAQAFNLEELPWFSWTPYEPLSVPGVRFEVATMPHPSGRSRFWNDPENVEQARSFLGRLLRVEK